MQEITRTPQEIEDTRMFHASLRGAANETSEIDAAAIAQAIIGALFAGIRIGNADRKSE